MKKIILSVVCIVAILSNSFAQERVRLERGFDTSRDLLLLQYDSWPDSDDIHSQAAAGCMLRHSDWSDINYYAVAGAYGVQVPGPTEDGYFIDSTSLFNLAFGPENVGWTDAHNHKTGSINRIRDRAVAVLNAGGRVWVAEAGQSNITADWIAAVLAAGVPASVVKDNVWVIHHSPWNQTLMTDPDDFDYVSANATMYKRIGDGNADTLDNANRVGTPGYVADETTYMNSALASSNLEARALWAETNDVLDAHYAANTDITNGNPHISIGGVDFSDTVVMWAILRDDNVESVDEFWDKYVVNTDTVPPTTGSQTYIESGGLVVMEAENTPSNLDQWIEKTSGLANEPTSGSYLEFDGNTWISGPAMSPLTYTFKINTAGTYFFNLRCSRETVNDRDDVANDCYIRVEGDYDEATVNNAAHLEDLLVDTKFFGGNDRSLVWAAGARMDLAGVEEKVTAVYNFKAGETYTLVLSGRSQLFKIDRIVFRRSSVPLATARDLTLPESEVEIVNTGGEYTYEAVVDFPNLTDGDVPYYVDTANNALAIAAGVEANRIGFAEASRTFDGISGDYQVTITTMPEEDGESEYHLLVNGSVVATYTNPYIGPGSPLDRQPHLHTWNNISLQNGDTIAIESNADTNGEIPEGDGTAWARGRWLGIDLVLSGDTSVGSSFYLNESAMDTAVENGNLVVGSLSGSNNDHRSFVKPDLSSILTEAEDVESAVFRIYRNDTGTGSYQYGGARLYAMTAAFDQDSATTDYEQLTGNLIGTLPNDTGQYIELDVTSLVQSWREDPSTYHGFAIQGTEGFGSTGKSFDSTSGANPPQVEVTSSNLLGHWPLDDESGIVAADLSGNGHDGTVTNGTWISGNSGGALDLDGSSSYVTLPTAAFDGVVSTNEITVSLWLDGSTGAVLRASDEFGRVFNILFNSNGNLYWDAGNSSTNSYDRISKTVSPSEHSGEWSHWVFTKNANTGVMSIYRNGLLWHTGTGHTRTIDSISAVYLGSAGSVSYFNGSLDQVELYNKALTAEEIMGLYLDTQNPYRAWLSQHSNQPSDTGFYTDPDGDGLANGLEYLFNTDPADETKNALLSMPSMDENSVVFSFERNVTSATNTTQIFEYSSDLSNWIQLQLTGSVDSEVSIGTAVDGLEPITVTIPATEVSGEKIFGRISIVEN